MTVTYTLPPLSSVTSCSLPSSNPYNPSRPPLQSTSMTTITSYSKNKSKFLSYELVPYIALGYAVVDSKA
ncbi:hypothetical protein CR513_36290, partial [Mucuna pruriens]